MYICVLTYMSAYTCVWMYMCACLWSEAVDTTCLCCLLPVLQFEVEPLTWSQLDIPIWPR